MISAALLPQPKETLEEFVRLCKRLLQLGTPGPHFYTMNQAEPTLAIAEALGLTSV